MIYYKKKIQQEAGATAIEYGLLSALIAITTIVALQSTGTNLGTTYCTIANKLSQAVGAGSTASGCSASSSSSSSSSSADSSGSSADSSGSSSSGSSDSSADASSSSDNSAVMKPASGTEVFPFPNVVSQNLAEFAMSGITSISGFYDANRNELTTPKQLANSVGVNDDLYNQLVSDMTAQTPDNQKQMDVQQAVRDAVTKSGKQYYVPSLENVSFKTSSGTTYSYSTPTTYWATNHTGESLYDTSGGTPVNLFTRTATGD